MKYVAFFDILGFSDLVMKNNHQELLKIYEIFNLSIQQSHCQIFKPKEDDNSVIIPDFSTTQTNSICISDSVLVWTNDDSFKSYYFILQFCNTFLWHSFINGLPVRGAVTVGELTRFFDKHEQSATEIIRSTFVGLTVVESYKLANLQNWTGVIITNECYEHKEATLRKEIERNETKMDLGHSICIDKTKANHRNDVIKYQAPLKSGPLREVYVSNWTKQLHGKLMESEIRERFHMHKKDSNKWEVENIIRNSIKFINETIPK
jgi:hypothetical protein